MKFSMLFFLTTIDCYVPRANIYGSVNGNNDRRIIHFVSLRINFTICRFTVDNVFYSFTWDVEKANICSPNGRLATLRRERKIESKRKEKDDRNKFAPVLTSDARVENKFHSKLTTLCQCQSDKCTHNLHGCRYAFCVKWK